MRTILPMLSISFVNAGCTCGIAESLRINVCRIAQYSDALADVQIVSWSANRTRESFSDIDRCPDNEP